MQVEENVSRETLEQLQEFSALVGKWTKKINLISKHSVDEIWDRHIVDSMQVFHIAPKEGYWVDLGSGGGFPGIVAAILSRGAGCDHRFTLVESDQRKAVFLRTAQRTFDLNLEVRSERIEGIDPLEANILSARALADLPTLLQFANQHMRQDGIALFMKGTQWQNEDKLARTEWSYDLEAITSVTNADAAVLEIKDIVRV